ncbi:MAG: hypothetical protein RR243_22400, partial [Citrobacter sp.]
ASRTLDSVFSNHRIWVIAHGNRLYHRLFFARQTTSQWRHNKHKNDKAEKLSEYTTKFNSKNSR